MSEINKNAEKKNTGLTEELSQLKKNRKKTADNLKSEEDKVLYFACYSNWSSSTLHRVYILLAYS